ARTPRPEPFYTQTDNGDKVQLLSKSGQTVGAGKLLKVMAKDRLHVMADYYIPSTATDNSNANGLNSVVNDLLNVLNGSGAPSALKGSGATITNELNANNTFTSFMQPQQGTGGSSLPKAYLNILFF